VSFFFQLKKVKGTNRWTFFQTTAINWHEEKKKNTQVRILKEKIRLDYFCWSLFSIICYFFFWKHILLRRYLLITNLFSGFSWWFDSWIYLLIKKKIKYFLLSASIYLIKLIRRIDKRRELATKLKFSNIKYNLLLYYI